MAETAHSNDAKKGKSGSPSPEIVILRVLFEHAKILIGLTLIVGVLVALYTLTLSNTYNSNAALVIREPQVPITGEAAPLSVEMLQSLTESTEVKRVLFDTLQKTGVLPEKAGFASFQRSLQTTIVQKKSRQAAGTDLVPMLVLTAASNDPKTAKAVANEWADIVVQRSQGIYTEGVSGLSFFIHDVYETADKNLGNAENLLTSTTLKANLDIEESRLKKVRSACVSLQDEVFDLDQSIDSNRILLKQIKGRLREQEMNGGWVGFWVEENVRSGKPIDLAGLTTTSLEVARVVRAYVEEEMRLADYTREKEIPALKKVVEATQDQLQSLFWERGQTRRDLGPVRAKRDVYANQLKSIKDKIVFNKAITDDALWNAYVDGKLKDDPEMPSLATEEENPLFQKVSESLIDMQVKMASIEQRLVSLDGDEKLYRERIRDLTKQIEIGENEIRRRQESIKKLRADVSEYRMDYENESRDAGAIDLRLVKDLALRQKKADFLKTAIVTSNALADKIAHDKLAIASLERNVERYKNIQTSLAGKTGEIDLLKVTAMQASRSGTTILYRAEENPMKVAPLRTRMVLAAMAIFFALASTWIVSMRFLREE